MAKKAVATLQTGNSGRAHSKCIKMVKSPKTGAYIFQEEIVVNEKVNEFFKKKKKKSIYICVYRFFFVPLHSLTLRHVTEIQTISC